VTGPRADPWSIHVPALAATVAATTGPVLELGCGLYSTPLLHLLCADRLLVSVEQDPGWASRFEDLRVPGRHELVLTRSWEDLAWLERVAWDVVFVDHAPARRRVVDLARLRSAARFLVVHDTEADEQYGWEPLLSSFAHRADDRRARPWTTVVSDSTPIPFAAALARGLARTA
jgi:hypothetical protein